MDGCETTTISNVSKLIMCEWREVDQEAGVSQQAVMLVDKMQEGQLVTNDDDGKGELNIPYC